MKKLEINQILYDIYSKLKKIEDMESQEEKLDIQLLVDISNTKDRIKKITDQFKEKHQLTSMIYVPLQEKLQDADKLDIGQYKKERIKTFIKYAHNKKLDYHLTKLATLSRDTLGELKFMEEKELEELLL